MIDRMLSLYAKYDVIPAGSWHLDIPVITKHYTHEQPIVGHCIVSFDPKVCKEKIALTRILMDHENWPHTGSKIQCNWQWINPVKFKHFSQNPRIFSSSWRKHDKPLILTRPELARSRSRSV